MNVTDGASEETIVVAPYWPGEGYGGGTKVASMEEAIAEAKHLAKQGYGKGKSIIHIVRTTRTVIEWNHDHSDLATLPRPEADEGAVTALRAVMGLDSVQTLFEAAEEYPHGPEDVAAELSALKLARAAMARGGSNG